MFKKSLVAVAAILCGSAAVPSFAAALKCEAPVIQVAKQADAGVAQYSITCQAADPRILAPTVTFAGEVNAQGTAPYLANASYFIDLRSATDLKLGVDAREDQVALGAIVASTLSVAALPTQFAAKTAWDPVSSVFSIEERPGQWRAYSFVLNQSGGSLVDAGIASTSVAEGRATAKVAFGKEFSRFAGAGVDQAVVDAVLGLDRGKLVLLVGDSRVASMKAVQGALLQLDTRPKDISRAWALAARAQFLGLADEVRYAEQKVAAHNPQLLEEFQLGLGRIKPYVLPAR